MTHRPTGPGTPDPSVGAGVPGSARPLPQTPVQDAPRPQPRVPLAPWKTALGAVGIGLVSGLAAVLWQGWSTVLTSGAIIVVPWGALLGSLLVFVASLSWGLKSRQRWAAGLTGLVAFCVVGVASLGGNDLLMVPLDQLYFTATPGAAWSTAIIMIGSVVATLVATAWVARYVPARPAKHGEAIAPRRPGGPAGPRAH